jgi:hypothetical protein
MIAVICAVLGWAGLVPTGQRAGLYILAAGLLWAGPTRFLAKPGPGLPDLVFLVGVALLLGATYGRAVVAHLDALDGRADGQVGWRRRWGAKS